jgi:hypothetical protein
MRYRMLEPHEKPDRRMGDEFKMSDGSWMLTCHIGRWNTVLDEGYTYRRPLPERMDDA